MSTDFAWDRNSLSQADTISDVPCLIDKSTVSESKSKMKNDKASWPSSVLREAGEAGVGMITGLVNHITAEGVI